MKLHLTAIGSGRGWTEHDLACAWFGKLPYPGRLNELTSKKPAGPVRQRDEGEKILATVPPGGLLFAMDPNGRDLASDDLANLISRYRDNGCRDAVFAIGGADGHDRAVLDQAETVLAFGRQTWPHMLFRAMLAEQLYRAEMILAGHPYHHG
ncbi:MAG: 23S rRNA (pseudouridine(1915)-N(3))-methyltransferase RlmH [Candidatus Puniceispirillales bacterium]